MGILLFELTTLTTVKLNFIGAVLLTPCCTGVDSTYPAKGRI